MVMSLAELTSTEEGSALQIKHMDATRVYADRVNSVAKLGRSVTLNSREDEFAQAQTRPLDSVVDSSSL